MANPIHAKLQHRWRRWRGLSARERRTLLQAVTLIPLAGAMVRMLSAGKLRQLLSKEVVVSRPVSTTRVAEVVEMVAIAADRGPMRAACLTRAVTACILLRREGIAADVCLGGARKEGKFAAHAWVQCGGEKFDVARPPQREFLPFDAPLAASRRRR